MKYRCDRGHEIDTGDGPGTWTTYHVSLHRPDGTVDRHDFNYCPVCFGEWAVGQWPLKQIDAP